MPRFIPESRNGCAMGVLGLAALLLAGCMVGPNYKEPTAHLEQEWMDAGDPGVQRGAAELTKWWEVLHDPVLNTLVERAYQNNPSLHAAAIRVLQAQAARGIAVGLLFPQQQDATGSFSWNQTSENAGAAEPQNTARLRLYNHVSALQGLGLNPVGYLFQKWAGEPGVDNRFHNWELYGLSVGWELDVWGRFRRGIEAADATVLASLANYDDVLVSLIAEVAADYVLLRTSEEQLEIVRQNLKIQQEAYEIVKLRREGGTATELDVAQAETLMHETEAEIPATEASIRQTKIALCTLLGMPPQDISELLGEQRPIPSPPEIVRLGVPAELLRRRPDIRRAERLLAAQCANIGIAVSDLYPHFSLNGDIGLSAEHFPDLYRGNSFQAFAGPSVRWAILDYGRFENNVRVQDAVFQASISDYENLVLQAQGEVERAVAGLIGAQQQLTPLTGSVEAASRAVDVAQQQYKGGIANFTTVLVVQQFLLTEQSRLVDTRGLAAQNLIILYRALGGGWELREGKELVPTDIKEQMRKRTDWDGMITVED
ncbi:MAG TPA: efflux transporter outer membrane subunit [Phycisphaerae bacterium]|nr:efflux transporter outer membrane subunit [Phycisphaerae bacterium]